MTAGVVEKEVPAKAPPRPRMRDRAEGELKKLVAKHGGKVTPRLVVEYARNPRTALHARFTWDDGEAAEKYRLWEARALLNVFVTVLVPDTEPVRVFTSLSTDRHKRGGYRLTTSVLSDTEHRAIMLADAKRELHAVKLRYQHLNELAEVWAAINKAG